MYIFIYILAVQKVRTFAGNVYPRKFSKLLKIGLIGSYFPIIVVKEKTAEIVESAETNGQSTNLKIKRTFSSLNENHLVSWLTFEFVGFIHILLTRKRGGREKENFHNLSFTPFIHGPDLGPHFVHPSSTVRSVSQQKEKKHTREQGLFRSGVTITIPILFTV